jgi:hypothetical protein
MKSKIIKKITFFFIIFSMIDVLLVALMMCFFSHFHSIEYGLAKNYPDSDILIMGTSHAEESFIPIKMQEHLNLTTYNLGRARRNIFFNYHLSKFLISNKRKPKNVILVMSYNDFRESTRPYMVSQFVESNEKIDLYFELLKQRKWDSVRGFFYTDLFSSSYRMMASRMLSWLKNRKTELPYYEHREKGYNGSAKIIKDAEKPETFKKHPFSFYPMQREYLIKTIRLWKQANCKVIIVDTPEFIGTRKSESEYDVYEKFIDEIATNENILFKSFNDPKIDLLKDPKKFKDGGWGKLNSHLNTTGAVEFTELFCVWLSNVIKK